MAAKPATIDEYISTFPEDIQVTLRQVRDAIRAVLPETVTEEISYGIPTFKLQGRAVVYFSGWKHHVSLHPLPHSDHALQQEIAPYVTGKGTVQFPLEDPIPYDLIEKIAKALAKERTEA